ncbi:uncharacterized protein YlxW (UPF0749 family) [Ureibacillus xyleni]|uniref:Uncharacterized protein YlxW (UPF0749 family) n=1 Tax=Ureibacillus xyleni TaxID=614648 RepID=A0A285REA6_9BACL|nr:DUF881 domain-containing protein [Ureibacillus xyleni]SOB92436.1 uncharacterized protein YlxW (UPF0749 family) [Ureibacillus xyleni]
MNKRIVTRITIVSFIVGLMIAIQYNTIQKPTERDTRDIWEIRQELSEEKKRHSELLSEIGTLKSIVDEYENDDKDSQAQILKSTVHDLKVRAGIEAVSGPGVIMSIQPAMELVALGLEIEPISPDLLIRLVNEIYRYNGLYIEIDGQRLVHTSAIRDINGKTTINGFAIDESNVEIRVITESFEKAEKLYSYLYASTFHDDFYLDNLSLNINKALSNITIKEYDGKLSNTFLVENNKGE